VENLFGDDGLGVFDTDWAMYERDAEADEYNRLAYSDPIEQGNGYWIKVLTGTPEIRVSGGITDDSGGAGFQFPLFADVAPGQANLVGHPFTFDVPWGDVEVVDGASVVPLSDPASAAYIHNRTMWTYDAGYKAHNPDNPTNPGTLTTFDGFWVRSLAAVDLRIPSAPPAKPAKRQIKAGERGPDDWWVRIGVSAEEGEFEDAGNGLGHLAGSSDGFDEQDLEELEPMGPPYLTLVFPHDDWGLPVWSFTTDFRQSNPGVGGRWNLDVRSDISREVTLWWSLGGAVDGVLARSALIDEESGEVIDPSSVSSYSTVLVGTEHALTWRVNTLPLVECSMPASSTIGFPAILSAAYTDADEDDTHTATVDWGDGVTGPAVVDV
jgi:hypothetical protein